MRFRYAKNEDGQVHLISALNSEYTLCGDAFDGGEGVGLPEQTPWTICERGPVTCQLCIKEIDNCRGVRVCRPNNDLSGRRLPVRSKCWLGVPVLTGTTTRGRRQSR